MPIYDVKMQVRYTIRSYTLFPNEIVNFYLGSVACLCKYVSPFSQFMQQLHFLDKYSTRFHSKIKICNIVTCTTYLMTCHLLNAYLCNNIHLFTNTCYLA